MLWKKQTSLLRFCRGHSRHRTRRVLRPRHHDHLITQCGDISAFFQPPKAKVRNRRLTEAEYRTFGGILRKAAEDDRYHMTTDIIRQIALTGCRRSEMIKLRWIEADMEASCLRLVDSKEGASTRPIGLPVVEHLSSPRNY